MANYKDTVYTNVNEAIEKLNLNKDNINTTDFEASAISIDKLSKHELAADVLIVGITPSELCDRYGAQSFDFPELIREFSAACYDFMDAVGWGTKSYALDVCAYVLFKVGPETRTVKKPGSDKRWRIRVLSADHKRLNCIYVCTYKNTDPPKERPRFENGRIILTIKQASLLAIYKLSNVVGVSLQHDYTIMTPLAGAIFSKTDLSDITRDLNDIGIDMTLEDVIIAVLQSCQSGGHYLEFSQAHIAVSAAICATQQLKDEKLRRQIVGKTFKQYHSVNKIFDRNQFLIYIKYATGGIPSEFAPEKLIEEYNRAHMIEINLNFNQRRMLQQNLMPQRFNEAGAAGGSGAQQSGNE